MTIQDHPSDVAVAKRQRRSAARTRRFMLLASALAFPDTAFAQDASGTAAPAAGQETTAQDQIGDVVVTAQRRSETAQSVPLSLQVLDDRKLQNLQVQDFEDYLRYLPSVASNGANAGFNATVVVRGVVTDQGNVASGSLPTVGQYIDDQPITTIDGAPDIHIYDVARVEQLSGPQGTLFGASSMGGVLRVITNKPDTSHAYGGVDFEINKFSKGDFGGQAEGFLNLPLRDNIALRVVGWYDREGGYVDNVPSSRTYTSTGLTDTNTAFAQKDYNHSDTYGGRAALAIQLDDHWTVTPSIIAQETQRHGTSAYNVLDGDLKTDAYVPEDGTDRWYQAALTVQGKIGDFDLTYAGSYFQRTTKQHINYADYDYWYDRLYGYYATTVNNAGQNIIPDEVLINNEHFTKQSHELRIASPSTDRLRFVAGAFYQRQVQDIDLNYYIPGLADSLSVSGHAGDTWLTKEQRIDRDYALFGQADFDLTRKLTVTGGIRQYWYNNSLFGFFGTRSSQAACIGPAVVAGTPCTNLGVLNANGTPVPRRVADSGQTYKGALTYKFDSDHMVYASVADGFRPGGTNRLGARGQQNLGSATIPYQPDSLTNYEIGTKNTFWNRRAVFNLTVFDEEWHNIQLTTIVDGVGLIQNVGKARSRGVELTAGGQPVPGLNITFNGAYIDGKLLDNYYYGSTLQAAAGSRLPYSPKLKGNVIARYEWKSGDYAPFVQVAETYQSDSIGGFGAFDRSLFGNYPGYATTNLSLGFTKGPMHLEAYVNNLVDARAVTYRTYVYYVPQSGFYQYVIPPRRFGLRTSFRF